MSDNRPANAMMSESDNYATIVADPPWPYRTSETGSWVIPKNEGQEHHRRVDQMGYPTMSMDVLKALKVPAAANAHLYLWTTNAFMVEAHELAKAWGFKPKTIVTWVKTKQDGSGEVSGRTGYYFRGATEHFLFCVRGSLPFLVKDALPTAFLWPRIGGHSIKPEAFYDLVERVSPGPRLEMFARRNRMGWATWGNQSLEHVEIA